MLLVSCRVQRLADKKIFTADLLSGSKNPVSESYNVRPNTRKLIELQ